MKNLFLIALLAIGLVGCGGDSDEEIRKETEMKIEHRLTNTAPRITSVQLLGYTFNELDIPHGGNQTFILDKGMPQGYDNVNVVIHAGTDMATHFVQGSVNFQEGGVTTITISGCIASNCDGWELNWRWD